VDIDDTTILLSKTVDFLSPAQRKEYESTKLVLTLASIDPSRTAPAAGSISKAILIEGIKGHSKPLVLN